MCYLVSDIEISISILQSGYYIVTGISKENSSFPTNVQIKDILSIDAGCTLLLNKNDKVRKLIYKKLKFKRK